MVMKGDQSYSWDVISNSKNTDYTKDSGYLFVNYFHVPRFLPGPFRYPEAWISTKIWMKSNQFHNQYSPVLKCGLLEDHPATAPVQ